MIQVGECSKLKNIFHNVTHVKYNYELEYDLTK